MNTIHLAPEHPHMAGQSPLARLYMFHDQPLSAAERHNPLRPRWRATPRRTEVGFNAGDRVQWREQPGCKVAGCTQGICLHRSGSFGVVDGYGSKP